MKISHVLNQRGSYNFKCNGKCQSLNVVIRLQKHHSFRHKLPLFVRLVRSCCLPPVPTSYLNGDLRRHSMTILKERFLHFHHHKIDFSILILEALAPAGVVVVVVVVVVEASAPKVYPRVTLASANTLSGSVVRTLRGGEELIGQNLFLRDKLEKQFSSLNRKDGQIPYPR